MENFPPFVTNPSKPVEHEAVRTESKNFACGSLGVASSAISISVTWFLDLWILAMGEIAPCIGY